MVRVTMKKFLPLLLCFLLSIFTVARATKPMHRSAPDTKTLLNDANAYQEVASDDDDSMEVPSSNEGEDMNDDDAGDAPGDEDPGDDDEGDDGGGDDGGGDEGE